MRRAIATLGVVGLGLLGATVSANAAPPGKITICHATGSAANPYVAETINLSALSAHAGDTGDIVPQNAGDIMPDGQNLTPGNIALLNNDCVAVVVPPVVVPPVVVPPVVVPPVVDPPVVVPPVVVPPVVDPPVVVTPAVVPAVVDPPVVVTPAVVPAVVDPPVVVTPAVVVPPVVSAATTAVSAGAAPAAAATNVGYNVQTAVGGKSDAGIPAWLAALTGLFTAVAALVLWRSGVRARNANG
ncbi:hypothetical protein [Pseudarthrobacter sp. N5]|uniref:hypothetical protein n=1 Tax=Pseudarthrobacter sp. N5 TaxID=3418416 RepID=UPI003CE8E9E1